MNGYEVTIYGSDYRIITLVIADTKLEAFDEALYTLINSTPKLDLFDQELQFEAQFIETIEEEN